MPPISREEYFRPPDRPRSAVLPDTRPYYPLRNLRDITAQERERAAGFEDTLEREHQQYGQPFLGEEAHYKSLGDRAYAPLLTGEAGLTPEEQQQYLRDEDLRGLGMTPEELAEIGMTPEEARAITGDPFKSFDYFNPELLRGMEEAGADRQREAVARGGARLDDAIGPGLAMDPRFAGNMRGEVGAYRSTAGAALDPSRLRVSEDFLSEYPMSDEEVEAQAELAARGANTRYIADLDRLQQRSAESGMAAPFAEAALGSRMRRRAAIAGADVSTRARLDALGLQRDQMRQAELMRIGAEQGLTDRQIAAARDLLAYGLSAEQAIEQTRLGAERDVSGRRLGVGETLLGAELGSERDIAGRQQQVGQYITDTGMAYSDRAESERSRRAGQIYGARQDTSRYRQGQRYERGLAASDRLSGRSRDMAGERMREEQEGRGYVTGQQEYAGSRYEDFANRRIPAFRASTERTQGALNARLGQRNAPGGTERIFKAFL